MQIYTFLNVSIYSSTSAYQGMWRNASCYATHGAHKKSIDSSEHYNYNVIVKGNFHVKWSGLCTGWYLFHFQVREIEQEAYAEPKAVLQKGIKQTAALDLSKRLKDFRSFNDATNMKGVWISFLPVTLKCMLHGIDVKLWFWLTKIRPIQFEVYASCSFISHNGIVKHQSMLMLSHY